MRQILAHDLLDAALAQWIMTDRTSQPDSPAGDFDAMRRVTYEKGNYKQLAEGVKKFLVDHYRVKEGLNNSHTAWQLP